MSRTFRYDDIPAVKTKAGLLKGYQYNGVYIFKGIRYAQAKRFQQPEPVQPWDGVRDATSYGYACPLLAQDKPGAELMVPHRYWLYDEDCLNLNIWTKNLSPDEKRPVLVWLHGGGYVAGSAIEQIAYDGCSMSAFGDVVVVSVNHRLNLLGFLDLSPFGDKYSNSANSGLADLVEALNWINTNISAFGGNPDNVTLFGQSGGGMKASGLMQTPAADGLFHKVLIMSGVQDGKLLPPLPGGWYELVKAMLHELGLKETEVKKLEGLPYSELAAAYNKVSLPMMMEGKYSGGVPMPNSFYLGEPLLSCGFRKESGNIPMMLGSVFGEFSFSRPQYNKKKLSDQNVKKVLSDKFGPQAAILGAIFKKAYPDKMLIDFKDLDRVFRTSTKALAAMRAESCNAPVSLYNFTLDFPIGYGKPAWHCSDIPFFFHNTDKVEICSIEGVTMELEEKMSKALINFAINGNPNHSALPFWPAVKIDDEPTMIFDRDCSVRHNYDDKLLDKMEELLPPFNIMELLSQDIQH